MADISRESRRLADAFADFQARFEGELADLLIKEQSLSHSWLVSVAKIECNATVNAALRTLGEALVETGAER